MRGDLLHAFIDRQRHRKRYRRHHCQDNYVSVRVWNRGAADASNLFASRYWSPPATLVSPNLWTLVGYTYFPDVAMGSVVEVSTPGITWPSEQLPGMGHDCFVAAVGNAFAPGPNSSSFATERFEDCDFAR